MYFNHSVIIRHLYHITLSVFAFPNFLFLSKILFLGAAILYSKTRAVYKKHKFKSLDCKVFSFNFFVFDLTNCFSDAMFNCIRFFELHPFIDRNFFSQQRMVVANCIPIIYIVFSRRSSWTTLSSVSWSPEEKHKQIFI